MKVNNVYYQIDEIGHGEQKVLLLHGFTGTGHNFDEIISFFENKERYTFILIDLLGHGRSDIPLSANRYSMEHTVNDLKYLLDGMGINKVSVYGYSMGGRVALSFAVNYPEYIEKLILESTSPGLKSEEERIFRKKADHLLAKRIEEKGLQSFIDFWTDIPLFSSQKRLPSEKKKKIYQQRLRNSSLGLVNSLKGLGTGAQPSNWEKLSALETPSLLAVGEWDQKFVQIAMEMNKHMKKSKFVKISGAGHAIHVEQPRKFGKIVSEFLSN